MWDGWKGGTELEGTPWEGEGRMKLVFWPAPNESALEITGWALFLSQWQRR